jgi:hypothetical protein
MTAEEIYQAILRLPASDRLRLAKQLASEFDRAPATDYIAALRSVFGALRDDPVERPPQGTFETRDGLR